MIIADCSSAVWEKVKVNGRLVTDEWNDSEWYADDDFIKMVNTAVSIPEIDSKKVIGVLL